MPASLPTPTPYTASLQSHAKLEQENQRLKASVRALRTCNEDLRRSLAKTKERVAELEQVWGGGGGVSSMRCGSLIIKVLLVDGSFPPRAPSRKHLRHRSFVATASLAIRASPPHPHPLTRIANALSPHGNSSVRVCVCAWAVPAETGGGCAEGAPQHVQLTRHIEKTAGDDDPCGGLSGSHQGMGMGLQVWVWGYRCGYGATGMCRG